LLLSGHGDLYRYCVLCGGSVVCSFW
jgi:hypothetical protein